MVWSPDFVNAREFLAKHSSRFPIDALGALTEYIDASEAFFTDPSDQNLKLSNDAMDALEFFCYTDGVVMDAHTALRKFDL